MEVENIKKIFQLNPILGDAMNNQHYRLSSKTTIPLLFTFQKKNDKVKIFPKNSKCQTEDVLLGI